MGDLQNVFWTAIVEGIGVGIILGWMIWRLPVHAKRYMDRKRSWNENEIRRILGIKAAPLRSIEEIAADKAPINPHIPRHLRTEPETEWSQFRDDPRAWFKARVPAPRTANKIAEEKYQEIIWPLKQHLLPGGATSTGSFFGLLARSPAPWHGGIAVVTRSPTGAPYIRTSFTSANSGQTSVTAR